MPENSDLIGWVRECNRAAPVARTLVQFINIVCQKTTLNILTWIRGFRVKIANFSSFYCLSIPKRDLDTKETTPNIEVWPESLEDMLEYIYISNVAYWQLEISKFKSERLCDYLLQRRFYQAICSVIAAIGSSSNPDDDGNKNPTNLHIWQWKTVFLHALHVHFHLLIFSRRSRSFYDVKWPVLQLCGRC